MTLRETAASLINFPMTPAAGGRRGRGPSPGKRRPTVASKLVDKIREYLKDVRH
jgi:hypothetical protein